MYERECGMSQPATAHYTWRRPREVASNYFFALLLSFVAYMVAGAPFIYWGAKTTAYYVGHTTEATVVATNVEGFVGVPDDDTPRRRAIPVVLQTMAAIGTRSS